MTRRESTGGDARRESANGPVTLNVVAGQGTQVIALLKRSKVAHTVHSYAHDSRSSSFGLEAANALGVPPPAAAEIA